MHSMFKGDVERTCTQNDTTFLESIVNRRMVVPFPKSVINLSMRIYYVKENYKVSVVSEIPWYKQTDRQLVSLL